jgi:hypothetical protein
MDQNGRLQDVSVNCAARRSVRELTATIPNRQVGIMTVGSIRLLGGEITPAPTAGNTTAGNPFHARLSGITPQQAEALFTPTTANPNLRQPGSS